MAEPEAHVTRAHLMAYLDDELGGAEARRTADHLEACEGCRATLDELRDRSELFGRAVSALDVPAPERDAAAVREAAGTAGGGDRAGAGADEAGAGPVAARTSLRAPTRWATALKAASLLLFAATAAAAVVPDSPLREWIVGTVAEWTGGRPDGAGSTPAPGRATDAADALETVSIPVTGRAVVQIEDAAPGLRVVVRDAGEERLAVTARGARFETGDGSIGVAGPLGPELVVELPRSASAARISAGERILLDRERGRTTVHVAADTTAGELVLTLGGGGAGG